MIFYLNQYALDPIVLSNIHYVLQYKNNYKCGEIIMPLDADGPELPEVELNTLVIVGHGGLGAIGGYKATALYKLLSVKIGNKWEHVKNIVLLSCDAGTGDNNSLVVQLAILIPPTVKVIGKTGMAITYRHGDLDYELVVRGEADKAYRAKENLWKRSLINKDFCAEAAVMLEKLYKNIWDSKLTTPEFYLDKSTRLVAYENNFTTDTDKSFDGII